MKDAGDAKVGRREAIMAGLAAVFGGLASDGPRFLPAGPPPVVGRWKRLDAAGVQRGWTVVMSVESWRAIPREARPEATFDEAGDLVRFDTPC